MLTRNSIVAVLLLTALASLAFAGDSANWNSLSSLKSGQRIGVIQNDGKRIDGTFASVSDAAISIRTDQVISVPKDNVVRVVRRPRLNRGWHILIGAGIGVAGGIALNSSIGQYFRNEGHDTSPAVWIGAGAALGAGLGAASGGGEHTVYRHP